ncbi:hypothetical protein X801_09778 [Opisthorchis viverrini]|uniref:Major facilitator superfamily (MFS) profile domain-containing protein n=1 Tax=Opisthorchis viverrini TaxID=6198 RepID=A0A1S8WJ02_OPIVI|nr:hypothetical protein X801_09778 [Opisthorchis viverrini]
MAADASGTTYDADGQAVIKEQHTYEDDTCRGRCMYYACCRCSKRYYTACLSSLGFLITFGIRCNMSWAMLSMIARHNQTLHEQAMSRAHHLQLRHGADGVDHVVDLVGIINVTTKPDFYWTAKERGLVDGSFFFGYLVTQIPGGVIASKFAANKVFGVAVGGSALINLFIPWSCKAHYILVMILRTMQGLVEVRFSCTTYSESINLNKPKNLLTPFTFEMTDKHFKLRAISLGERAYQVDSSQST